MLATEPACTFCNALTVCGESKTGAKRKGRDCPEALAGKWTLAAIHTKTGL
jgi:hypothetical protein